MPWLDDREVPAIEGSQRLGLESFRSGDQRGVDGPEWKIPVHRDEFGDPNPVGSSDRLRNQLTRRQVAQEPDLRLRAHARPNQVRHFGHDKNRDDQGPRMALKQPAATGVFRVVRIVGRVERSGVDDQRAASSDRRISSIWRDTSARPLWPGALSLRLEERPSR